MNPVAILKRVLPFLAGLAVGLIPSWLFQPTDISSIEVAQPTYLRSSTACDRKSKSPYRSSSEQTLRIVSKPSATYTDAARSENTEGTVILRVTFLKSGEIGDVTTVKSLPNGLTEAAIEAARSIGFEPARQDGSPVTVSKQVEYSFSIY